LVFLGGGPSHHDTFDPKPDAPAGIRGEFTPISTAVPGIQISSALPLLAAQTHRTAILRAVTHRDAAHEPGVAYMNTGYRFRPGQDYAGMGAVVARRLALGSEADAPANQKPSAAGAAGLPPYIAIPQGQGAGHLGPSYGPFSIPGDPND